MSSLIGSIFGEKNATSSATTSLFESSSNLPDKPQHKPVARISKKKKKKTVEEAPAVVPKKKRKRDEAENTPRKEDAGQSAGENDAETATKENDDDVAKETDTVKNKNNDADDQEDRTIFVGNLPLDTTRKSLAAIFKDVGPVESTRLRSVATTGLKVAQAGNQDLVKKVCANTNKIDVDAKACSQGYVVFQSAESVTKALELNAVFEVEGRRLRVDRATPTVDASRSVFVGNLPYKADEATLRQHFERNCQLDPVDIENVRIVRDKETQQCKGFGYILFKEKTHVTTALQRMHESTYKKREIRVSVCGKRYKGRRGVPTEAQERKKQPTTDVGALQRIVKKEAGKKRKRGDTSSSKDPMKSKTPNGLSRRQASEAKLEKRHKKLQKRASKGMGKMKVRK